MDASNLLKPLLTSGQMRCMGSTTYQEYRGIFDKDRPYRRFQKIDVIEPDVDDTYRILKGLKSRFEGITTCAIRTKPCEPHRSWPHGTLMIASCQIRPLMW